MLLLFFLFAFHTDDRLFSLFFRLLFLSPPHPVPERHKARTPLGMVIQFILVNMQELTEFGGFEENTTPNIQEEKTPQWVLVCRKFDYVAKKTITL